MTIKSKGTAPNFNQLKFSEIEAEFGSTPGRRLGRYRSDDVKFENKNLGDLSNLPLDTGIPTGTSDKIKFSDFYGKQLNMVIDYYDDTGTTEGQASDILNRQDDGDNTMAATWRYNNQSERVKVVGGYTSRPTGTFAEGTYNLSSTSWQGGKKVIIHVNKFVGGKKASEDDNTKNRVALRTGGWPSGTTLQIDIGSSGRLQGAGGNGGKGGSMTPKEGKAGTSALGVEYPAQINNNGIITCGYGGGGGGGGSSSNPGKSDTDYGRAGGSGGGGAGIPIGFGGAQNTWGYNGSGAPGSLPEAGQDATFDSGGDRGGAFGGGADHGGESGANTKSGGGGNGADQNDTSATKGQDGVNQGKGTSHKDGADGGPNGHGIIFVSNTVQTNSTGDKTLATNFGGVIVGGMS